MPAAPNPGNGGYQRPAPRIAVLLGQPGAAPTADDQVNYLRPLSIERSAGGKRIDSITLEYDLGKRDQRLVDSSAPIGFDREVEVVELDEFGGIRRVLAWGKIGVQPSQITSGQEQLRFKVRLDHHLFGEPLIKTPFWDETAGEVVELDHEWIFNPEIDEKVEPNRSSHQEEADADEAYLFVDPESLRTDGAESFQGQQAYLWKIAEAAHRLCWSGNKAQTHIKNPKLSEITSDLAGVPNQQLKNHKIKAGQYLPKALDDLLAPYGCGWYVSYEIDETDPDNPERIRKIRFFRDGVGTERVLYMQRPVQKLNTTLTNVEDLSVNFSIVDLANEIEGRSSFKERETTFPLQALWDPVGDSMDADELKMGSPAYKDYPHVGRKFGINTDGTYDGLRPETSAASDNLDFLKTLLGEECIGRRHIFKPCLSRVKNEEGVFESRGLYVEWKNPDADPEDENEGWEQVTASIHRSEKEAVIFLGSEKLHEGIWAVIQDDPTLLEMRITCTFTSDLRVHKTATRQATSPNGDTIKLFLDLSDKFHDRRVDSDSIFYGDGSAEEDYSAEDDMEDYLKHLRSIDDSAEVDVKATLEGLDHPEYEIGQILTNVEGRNLKFDANAPTGGTPRRLQIVAITLNLPDQTTDLQLETIQGDRP